MQGQECGVVAANVAFMVFSNANQADKCCNDIEAMTTSASLALLQHCAWLTHMWVECNSRRAQGRLPAWRISTRDSPFMHHWTSWHGNHIGGLGWGPLRVHRNTGCTFRASQRSLVRRCTYRHMYVFHPQLPRIEQTEGFIIEVTNQTL